MSNRKIIGWYVLDAAGQQVAWHKLRSEARKIAVDYSKRLGGVFYTAPEVEAA
jgi:hypothetical protein